MTSIVKVDTIQGANGYSGGRKYGGVASSITITEIGAQNGIKQNTS